MGSSDGCRRSAAVALAVLLAACSGGSGPAPAVCGDGVVAAGEACDDRGILSGDGCSAACAVEVGYACGGAPSVCAPICGDGRVLPGEPCDDGGLAPGDGCDASCAQEPLFSCAGAPSQCFADRDADQVADAADNCPDLSNAGQADADADGLGDPCDPCPAIPNPGGGACPVTIYELKRGEVVPGTAVSLPHALVTAVHSQGYFVQVKSTDPEWSGPDHSGLYVFDPLAGVAVGDRLTLGPARFEYFNGQAQLVEVAFTRDSSGEATPTPELVQAGEIQTGGARALALEGVLVEVHDVAVTSVAPPPGLGEVAPTGEFAVDPFLRVDDLLHAYSPFPVLGQQLLKVAGVLALRNGDTKVLPRSHDDVVGATPVLRGLSPAGAWTRLGRMAAPTIPSALTVSLDHPGAVDTFVAFSSSDAAVAVVTGGGVTVPAGQASAVVLVDGLAAGRVTLTATLELTTLAATVDVLDGTEVPAVAGLSPPTSRVAQGGQRALTVALSIPAPPASAGVALAVSPPGAATVPATVLVAPDAMEATFSLLNGGEVTTAVVTATLGASSASATVLSTPATGLLINEVDYDQPGGDVAEFIEILNPTAQPVFLDGVRLYLVNGATGLAYATVDLSAAGTLAPGQYLVVAAPAVTVAAGAVRLDFPGTYPSTGVLQNGAPDALALVDTVTGLLLDALVYEETTPVAALRAVHLDGPFMGMGPFSLVSGNPVRPDQVDVNTGSGALVRRPDGARTGDDATDWVFTATPTPGAANPATGP
ncbi:MAG: lamin tail domain-containing protein [Anaeromyxobacteraceae bacterium]|nr:lamin tail domain-containing protein [Anaeromyxobacteraceae bacterium]